MCAREAPKATKSTNRKANVWQGQIAVEGRVGIRKGSLCEQEVRLSGHACCLAFGVKLEKALNSRLHVLLSVQNLAFGEPR